MSALLAANTAAVLGHIFVHVLVANGGLCISYAQLVKCLVQTEVGHYSSNDSIVEQLATLFHVCAVYVKNVVARDNIALFINTQAAVSVAVVGKAHVKTVFHHISAQPLNMCGACVHVDIGAVRGSVYNIGLCAQSVKNGFCNIP